MKKLSQMKIVILEVSVIILAVFDVLLWQDVLAYNFTSAKAGSALPIIVGDVARTSNSTSNDSGIGLPVSIKIPSIALEAAIEKVAMKSDGSMDVPKQPFDTGWYELGSRPGEIGSAVIAGHVNWWDGATGVFEDLNKLKIGDKITVEDDKGAVISFVVSKISIYDAAEDASNIFKSFDGISHLNLITCDGVWNKKDRQYPKRLIVFSDREYE